MQTPIEKPGSLTAEEEYELLDRFAIAILAARVQAAWSNPVPSNEAWQQAKKNRPPGVEELNYDLWLAKCAYRAAVEALRVRADVAKATA